MSLIAWSRYRLFAAAASARWKSTSASGYERRARGALRIRSTASRRAAICSLVARSAASRASCDSIMMRASTSSSTSVRWSGVPTRSGTG